MIRNCELERQNKTVFKNIMYRILKKQVSNYNIRALS